jgi:hypothetical protein
MLSSATAFEISDHQFRPRNPATECDNVTCPADGEITIRQPQDQFFNSIAFCIVALDVYDGDNQTKEKDDDIAHPGMVSKPKKRPIGPIQ